MTDELRDAISVNTEITDNKDKSAARTTLAALGRGIIRGAAALIKTLHRKRPRHTLAQGRKRTSGKPTNPIHDLLY